MSNPSGKVIAYDGDCPFCVGTTLLLMRAGLLEESNRRAFQDFEDEQAERIWQAGIRNEIAVLGPNGDELRTGSDGLLWILEDGWSRPIARFLSLPGLRQLTRHTYRLVSYNRRALALPKPRGVACACDPDDRPAYQLTFTLLVLAIALGILGALAGALATQEQGTWFRRTLQAGTLGWLVPVLCAVWRLEGGRLRFLTHLSMALWAGALITAFTGIASALFRGTGGAALLVLALALGAGVLHRSLTKRTSYLRLAAPWHWSWVAVWLPIAVVFLLLRSES